MNNAYKILFGIAAIALIISVPAMAFPGFGVMGINSGMMGAVFAGGWMHGMMGSGAVRNIMGNAAFENAVNGTFNATTMRERHKWMHGNITSFDMDEMHLAMVRNATGNISDLDGIDMNAMHRRMIAGNLTQTDFEEMKAFCPMLR